jgi:hypothetical protein
MDVPFVLGLGNVWIPLTGVQREVPRTRDRGKSEWFSMSNRRRMQFSARSARTWKLSYDFKDPSAVKWLAEAAAGQAGPVWLLDRAAAQLNMLDPKDTAGRFSGQPSIDAGPGIPSQTFPGTADAFSHRVRGGQTYHLTGWTNAVPDALLGFLRLEVPGQDASIVEIKAPGSGVRMWSASIESPVDGVLFFYVVLGGATTRLRLTEGSVDEMDFYPGQNTPCRVAVSDPDEVLSLYREGHAPRSSYTVELYEVG